jgi:hypothetical protein
MALTTWESGYGADLYAGGSFSAIGDVSANNIAKWDGAEWSPLGAGLGGGNAFCFCVFDDGTGPALYVGGSFETAGGIEAPRLAKWDGVSWSRIADVNGHVMALAVFDDGTGPALYIGGSFDLINGIDLDGIAKWNGVSWASAGGGMKFAPPYYYGHVAALEVVDDGLAGC